MPNIHSFDKHNLVILQDPPASQVSANTTPIQPFAGGTYGANRCTFMLTGGAVGTSLVGKITQATTSAFTDGKDITGATATISNANENKFVTIEIDPGQLDDANGFTWVRLEVVATGTCVWCVHTILHQQRHAGLIAQDSTYLTAVRLTT